MLADIRFRHLVPVRIGHLYIVAKHSVVAYFQLGDTGFFPLLGLNGSNHAGAVDHNGLQTVNLFIIALFDKPAFTDRKGRLLHNGTANFVCHIGEQVNIVFNLPQHGGVAVCQSGLDLRQSGNGALQRPQLLGIGGTVHNAGHQPLNVVDTHQCLPHRVPQHGAVKQLAHRILAAENLADAQQRSLHPGADHPFAHGGLGFVNHPQQRMLLVAGHHGAGQLQVAPGTDVQVHKPLAVVKLHFRRGLDLVFLLGVFQISDYRAQCAHRFTAMAQVQCGNFVFL